MADFFWVGQTPTNTLKLSAFSWNVQDNWRQKAAVGQELIQVTTAGRIPGGTLEPDRVFIGAAIEQKINGVWTEIPAKSPLLFGGCTGIINSLGTYVTGGTTWAHAASMTSAGSTYPISEFIMGEPTAPVHQDDVLGTFRKFYKFPIIGGGVTGGNGYFNTVKEIKDWFNKEYKSIVDSGGVSAEIVFGTSALAAQPNKDNLKIKALTVKENMFNRVPNGQTPTDYNFTVSMCIPRSYEKGTTFAATKYLKNSWSTKTYLKNSVINTLSNAGSHRYYNTPALYPYPSANNLVLDTSVIHYYEGYYQDPVNIKPNCYLTYAQLLSPVTAVMYDPYNGFNNSFNISGVFGITYTTKYTNITGNPVDTDGLLVINDPRPTQTETRLGEHETGYFNVSKWSIPIGDASGVTSYFKQIKAENSQLAFRGTVIADDVNVSRTYMVYDSPSPTIKDKINLKYLTLRNASTLNVSYSPNFDNWKFGDIPAGQSLVQGGIYAEGSVNYFVGSPGVKLYNEFYTPSASATTTRDGKRLRDTNSEISWGTEPTGAPAEAN